MCDREDWKPVLTINSIIYGLQYLFLVSDYFLLVGGHVTADLITNIIRVALCLRFRSPTPRTP